MSDLPQSTHQGTVTIMGVELVVHRLDDGRSIIEGDGLPRLIEAMATTALTPEDAEAIATLLGATP